ncbi:MAG: hypothetical protein E7540_06420 [Ruminococcaceae bacterium]|nr:hypothetical protein [Oscillospiraceae bacterium]
MIKKFICLCLVTVLVFCFSGCSLFEGSVDDMLLPPKLEGEMRPIQEALEDAAGQDITLRYPETGEYRSAIVLKDLNNDAENEAIAFYSVTEDSTVTMHINVIAVSDEQWQSKGDMSLVGNGIEKVTFADLDGDGSLEIIVGFLVFGTVDKKIGVYSFNGETFVQRALEQYTNFVCVDMTKDGIKDLTLIYHNAAEKSAFSKVFSMTTSGIAEVGKVALDGGITSYLTPVISSLRDGSPAIYIDAVKGSGMLTEILWFTGGTLKTVYDSSAPEANLTYRQNSVESRDYNGDSVIDIPLSEILISTASLADIDKVYFTNWSDFDGHSFRTLSSSFVNISDGYSLTVPAQWKDKIYLLRRTEQRMRVIYSYDPSKKTSGKELFRIAVVADTNYDSQEYLDKGYFELAKEKELVYLARINQDNSFEINEKTVLSMFELIK